MTNSVYKMKLTELLNTKREFFTSWTLLTRTVEAKHLVNTHALVYTVMQISGWIQSITMLSNLHNDKLICMNIPSVSEIAVSLSDHTERVSESNSVTPLNLTLKNNVKSTCLHMQICTLFSSHFYRKSHNIFSCYLMVTLPSELV